MPSQVRTKGYVALGFSMTGGMRGSDMMMAWITDGAIFFQVRMVSSLFKKDVS
jgi:hypothetical protein